ncbi:hypothetical protein A2U01_0071257, partial [Trifolium medium]|nr:hypothetical protein [Trifolium medium]
LLSEVHRGFFKDCGTNDATYKEGSTVCVD